MTPNPFLEDLILMIPPECLEDQESAQSQPGYGGESAASAGSEPSAAIRANTELLPHLEPAIRPHAQFIDAALSYYHGTEADRDVRDAWVLITDRLTQLRLERDHARAISAWRPIESAPKDGTEIIVWREDAGVFTASFCASLTEEDEPYEPTGDPCWFTHDGEDLTGDLPTLWQPMPSPPSEAASPIGGQVQTLDEPEISWKSRTQKAEAALAEAVGVLKPFADKAIRFDQTNRVSNDGGKTFGPLSSGVCVSGITIGWCRRAASFLSLLGEAGREEVRGSSVADSGGTASPKSDSSEGH